MNPEDRNTLLAYARTCVQAAMERGTLPELRNPSPPLSAFGAAFVTLRSRGNLRGCIGQIQAMTSLWKSVRDMAEASATRDPRFSPLQPGDPFQVEISIISDSFSISPDQVRVGTHGLIVEREGLRGMLLPHVAIENDWTATRFLEQTVLKAGLPKEAIDDPNLELRAFTAELISE